MITLRSAAERGVTETGWLYGQHSFSFGHYYDPSHMGFGPLRVINEDVVKAGAGFPKHGHRDMEIITYVLEGELAHKDSLGNQSTIRPGEVQKMSAGSGIEHSEFNASQTNPVHLLQIWIMPERNGIAPGYAQVTLPQTRNDLILIGAPDAGDHTVPIAQDAKLWLGRLDKGKDVSATFEAGRLQWLQAARGEIEANGVVLKSGDGAAIRGETALTVKAREDAEFLLFDMVP